MKIGHKIRNKNDLRFPPDPSSLGAGFRAIKYQKKWRLVAFINTKINEYLKQEGIMVFLYKLPLGILETRIED